MKTHLKKMLGLMLVTMMTFSAFGCIATAEESDESENLVINSGFEELDESGNPVNWSQYKSGGSQPWNPDIVSITTETTHSGQNALLVKNNKGSFLEGAFCDVHGGENGFVEDGLYEFSFYYNADFESANGGLKVYAEFYGGDNFNEGVTFPSVAGKIINEGTNKLWGQAKAVFTIPAGVNTVTFYVGIWGAMGEAYIDDCAVRLSEGPEKFFFDTEETFIYPEQTESEAFLIMDDYYDMEEAKNVRVDFQLYDPADGTVIKEQKDTVIKDYRAVFSYESACLAEMKKQYAVKAVWWDIETGETIGEFSRNVYRYPRPEMLDEKGMCIIDGEIFRPVLAYHLDPIDYIKAKEMGINVVEVFGTEPQRLLSLLDQAYAAGLKVLISMDGAGLLNGSDTPLNQALSSIKRIVRETMEHPALFGYTPDDEPFGGANGTSLDEKRYRAEQGYIAIHEMDAYHPIFFVDYFPGFMQSWKYCDYFARDIYLYNGGSNTSKISAGLYDTHLAVEGKKQIMEVVLSQENASTETIRAGLYRTLEAECSGLGFYTYSDYQGDGNAVKKAFHYFPTYEPTKVLMNEEIPLMYDHVIMGEGTRFSKFESDVDEGTGLYFISWLKDGKMYMVIHNRDHEEKEISVPLISSNGQATIGAYHAEPIGASILESFDGNGNITIPMQPDQVVMLAITPETKPDEALLGVESNKNHAIPKEYAQALEEPAGNATGFADLGQYEWAREQIETLYEAGIVNSLNTYRPGDSITRGDAAMYLMRTLGREGSGAESFADVPEDAYYAKEIQAGRALGLLNGVGNNLFNPEGYISRQDLLVIVARGMRLINKLGTEADMTVLDKYADKDGIAEYAKADLAALTSAGIIEGDGKNANPLGLTTRAEAAVMMHRILNAPEIEVTDPVPEEPEKTEIALPENSLTQGGETESEKAVAMLKGIHVLEDSYNVEAAVTKDIAGLAFKRVFGSDKSFTGDGAVTYQEAVCALLDALGYTVYAESIGGYPTGYLAIAEREEMLQGLALSREDNLSGAAFALLMRNALEMETVEPTGFDADGSLGSYNRTGRTALSDYLHIYTRKGRVTGEYYRAMGTPVKVKEGEVSLEGLVLAEGKSGASALFGQKVTAYTVETAGGEEEILYAEPTKNTKVIKLDGSDIFTNSTTSMLHYKDENSAEKKINLSGATFVHNGREKNVTAEELKPQIGSVTLISDANGDVNVVLIESYVNRIVNSVSPSTGIIRFKDGSVLACEEGNLTKRVQLLKADGTPASVGNCQEWNVLSVMQSADEQVTRAILSTTTVRGVITEISDEDVVIEGKAYLKDRTLPKDALTLGVEKRYAVDFTGRIAAVTNKISGINYGYLLNAEVKTGLDSELFLKILTADNEVVVFPASEKISLNNGEPLSATDFMKDARIQSGQKVKKQIITYTLSGNGTVTAIETETDGTAWSHEERQGIFTLDYSREGATLYYLGEVGTNTFNDKYRVMPSTVLFVVPVEDSDNDKDYKVVSASTLKTGANFAAKNNYLFDINSDYTISAMVIKTGSSAVTVSDTAAEALIMGKVTKLDENGDVINGFKVMTSGGIEAILEIPDDVEFIFEKPTKKSGTITTEDDLAQTGSFTADDLNVGDVIQYELRSASTISVARVMLRAKTPVEMSITQGTMGDLEENWNYNNLNFGFGTVKEVFEHGIIMKSTYEHLYIKSAYKTKAFPVIIYDSARGTFTLTDDSEIQVDDKLFISRHYALDTLWIIYR